MKLCNYLELIQEICMINWNTFICAWKRRSMPVFAPPENQPIVGYWGKPTSTLDFCEENYVMNFYMAEFCKL